VALWLVLGAVGFGILTVTIRLAGVDKRSGKRPWWLLVAGLVEIAIGFGLLVVATRR
jgi:hypothetical protein